MKQYLAYVRVSTTKQGERGSSLEEQRSAIERYAHTHNLTITNWYREMETAASEGRTQFTALMKELTNGAADGLIVHKIDRSARNLKDWARLGELIDRGVDVHFAHESLDLHTRGGRLSADIQAVVAADYIRNLRDEVRKGFYGRLKQGYFPMRAPFGYLDRGKAQVKEIDPATAPFVRQMFELYSTGRYSLRSLREEMTSRGMRNRIGKVPPLGQLSRILRNPFYIGLMHIGTTNETFEGKHEPLVPVSLFDRVSRVLAGKMTPKTTAHQFRFKQLVTCIQCGHLLTGERQKGFVYYRCHHFPCKGVSIREEAIDASLHEALHSLQYDEPTREMVRTIAKEEVERGTQTAEARRSALALQLVQLEERDARLTDALIDTLIDKDTYQTRHTALLKIKQDIQDQQRHLSKVQPHLKALDQFELGTMALSSYEIANDAEKADLVAALVSNFVVSDKKPMAVLRNPFDRLAKLQSDSLGGPNRRDLRTLAREIVEVLMDSAQGKGEQYQAPKYAKTAHDHRTQP